MINETSSPLTEACIRGIIQKKDNCNKDVIICNISTYNAVPKGNNYLSDIYRTKVIYKQNETDVEKSASFIIKSMITDKKNDSRSIMFVKGMEKERTLYYEYFPKINALIKNGDYLTPMGYSTYDKDLLVLEDMTFDGFKMADRIKGLDFEHSALAITTLAKFHALSVKVHEDDPKFVEGIAKSGIFFNVETNPKLRNFVAMSFQLQANELLRYPDTKNYAEFLLSHADVAVEMVLESMETNKSEFNVLNHGDFWVNNMQFKYDDNGNPVSIKMIDFTESRYSSPAVDLWYFLNGSVEENTRSRLDELIELYANALNYNLKSVDSTKRIDSAEIRRQMKEREFFGVFVTSTPISFFKADPKKCKVIDLNELLNNPDKESSSFKTYFENEIYLDIVRKRLQDYEGCSWFKKLFNQVQRKHPEST